MLGRRTVLGVAIMGALALSSVLAVTSGGPRAFDEGELDAAAYWLPRHRRVVAAHRHELPAAPSPARARARLKFRKSRRVSTDLLGTPPAELTTAQAETQTEPYLAVDPADPGHLLAGWQETRFTDGGARALGVAVSRNGGRRWSESLLPGLTTLGGGEWDRASDPWPAFGPDGIAYYTTLLVHDPPPGRSLGESAIAVSISRDGGDTWSDPVEVARSDPDFNDKPSMVVDTADGSRHHGNVYVGWDVNLLEGSVHGQRMVVARSTDEGGRWGRPVELVQGRTNIGIVLRVGADGTVYALWAGADDGDASLSLRFAWSIDGGRHFRGPRKVADYLAVGVAGYRSGAILPSLALDPTTGALYAAWPDARFTGMDQAALSVSRDGGRHWSAPMRVDDLPDGIPALTVGIAVNGAGELVVGYYAPREAGGTTVDYLVNRSTDGAATFEQGVRVNRKPIQASRAAMSGSGSTAAAFLGDYVGLAGSSDGFYALFTHVRKPSRLGPGRQPDIFAAVSR